MNDRPPMFNLEVAASGAASVKDMAPAWYQFMGIAAARENGGSIDYAASLVEFANAPADEAWVFSCVRRLANSAQSVPLRVYVKDADGLVPAEHASDSAAKDLAYLLNHVNGVAMNWSDLIAYTMSGLAVWGEGHWRKVRGRLGGAPQELWWLPATNMTPDPDPVWPKSWTYAPSRLQREQIPVRDLVTFKTVNLVDPTRGLSPLAAIRNEISVNRQASIHTRATLTNWGIPAGAWVTGKGEIITPQDQNLIRRALRALRGPAASGKTPVLPAGLTWQPLAMNAKDAEWIAARKISRMAICAALGVPLLLAGDDEHTSTVYAGLRDVERAFWRSTMIPWLDWIGDTINGWLVTDFDPRRERIEVAFDYSGIESLQSPLEDRKRVSLNEVSAGVLGAAEYRRIYKLGPDLSTEEAAKLSLESRVNILGSLVRSGFKPDDALELVGLPRLEYLDEVRPITLVPSTDIEPPPPDDTAEQVRALGRGLYRRNSVRAFLAGEPLDVVALIGHELPMPVRHQLEIGLVRRYSADQIADGVPAEGYAGLAGETV